MNGAIPPHAHTSSLRVQGHLPTTGIKETTNDD
jgi:hypothetical protein